MNLIFTLCSNNYLAQAKVLTDSAFKFSPNSKVIIGLIDDLNSQVDYAYFSPAEIITLSELQIEGSPGIFSKYSIVELNTSVKASYFKYLLTRFPEAEKIIYFDPDIKVFTSLDKLWNELETFDIILTPHIFTPIELDGYEPKENLFLKHGIYNLGFIGINTYKSNVKRFLNWWEDRILHECFAEMEGGYFVDQLPINLVPILFENVKVLEAFGYNMAPWNLHERKLIRTKGDDFMLQDGSPLFFYHFSSYDYRAPQILCKEYYNRFTFENRSDLINIYRSYQQNILDNRVVFFETIPCAVLNIEHTGSPTIRLRDKLFFWAGQFIPPVVGKVKDKFFKK